MNVSVYAYINDLGSRACWLYVPVYLRTLFFLADLFTCAFITTQKQCNVDYK